MATSRVLAVLAALLAAVRGHGMLIDPVNRGSMWRFGYGTPVNYNDNQQFCGGRNTQWALNGGKCGECGDDYALARPRPAENGGSYGKGIIVSSYAPGQLLTATVQITANHRGYFQFRLCPLGTSTELETEACFAEHLLPLADGSGTKYQLLGQVVGKFPVKLQLPSGLTCSHCVLQWTYTAGNSWGVCEDGSGAVGCGPQETFRTCSDIAIQ